MDRTQEYRNHAHIPVMTVVVGLFVLIALISLALAAFGYHTTGWALGSLIAAVFELAWISRRYTTRLQDRIILLEMRYRADRVLAPADRDALWQLARPQIVALRFASDAELPVLIRRTTADHLSATDIKKAITDWQADWDRT